MTAFINADDVNAGRTEMKTGLTGWHLYLRCPEELTGRHRRDLGESVGAESSQAVQVELIEDAGVIASLQRFSHFNAISSSHITTPPRSSQGTSFITWSNNNKFHVNRADFTQMKLHGCTGVKAPH